MNFTPDFNNVLNAALNKESARTPLYEHGISVDVLEKATNRKIENGDSSKAGLKEFFTNYSSALLSLGYDTVTYEECITRVLPGGGALANHASPVIKTRQDLDRYPFDEIVELYKKAFENKFIALSETMPKGMKAIGGIGNGVFEIAQDLVGYEDLMLLGYDDEDFYGEVFKKVGKMMDDIWKWFLPKFSSDYCVCRFGDDLGYKSNTMLPHDDIRKHIIPQYKMLVERIHFFNKPFLLHSCGCIFDVFEDIIREVKIDAKHSNEDAIADFKVWVDKFGDRIGNFGGIDTDHLVRMNEGDLIKLVKETMAYCSKGHGGFAIGSGNSIPSYVLPEKWLTMINTVREFRGDFKK